MPVHPARQHGVPLLSLPVSGHHKPWDDGARRIVIPAGPLPLAAAYSHERFALERRRGPTAVTAATAAGAVSAAGPVSAGGSGGDVIAIRRRVTADHHAPSMSVAGGRCGGGDAPVCVISASAALVPAEPDPDPASAPAVRTAPVVAV